ncbi:MAG: hypothetical protein HQ526_08860 [Actinobacteria bacterium]|nr:hypothetical protein [Actinomycetota bacterium]
MNQRFARIAATTLATGALLLGGGIAATAANAQTVNPQITDAVTSVQAQVGAFPTSVNNQITDAVTSSSPTTSGHDWNDVPDPTMRDLHPRR